MTPASAQAAVLELFETLSACVSVCEQCWAAVRDDAVLPPEQRKFALGHCNTLQVAAESLDTSRRHLEAAQERDGCIEVVLDMPGPALEVMAASVLAFERVYQPRQADLPVALTPQRLAPAILLARSLLPQAPQGIQA